MRTPIYPVAAAMVCLPAMLFAAGSEDTAPPEPTETTTECVDGQVFDEKTEACVDATDDQAFNDDDRYKAVSELAYSGAYERALRILDTAENVDDPRFLNYRGFINRKQGNLDVAMSYYQAALAQDPDYLLARSYMGQGLLADGDTVGAKEQLREIRLRGGRETWAYKSLSMAMLKLGATSY